MRVTVIVDLDAPAAEVVSVEDPEDTGRSVIAYVDRERSVGEDGLSVTLTRLP